MEASPYAVDALETDADMEQLLEVLDSVRDARGRPACLTANMVLTNPDFQRIRESEFREYAYEPATTTLSRHPQRCRVESLWKEGLARRLFVPQLHGREHIRWWRWLESLQKGSPEARLMFELGMCGVQGTISRERNSPYAPPYVAEARWGDAKVDLGAAVREGAAMFRDLFGYVSRSTIAPSYTWPEGIEGLGREGGVRYIQGNPVQDLGDTGRVRYHCLGDRGVAGGLYLIRNGDFEPAVAGHRWVARCLARVGLALRLGRPAVIGTHRVNYIGAIRPENRDSGLRDLRQLLEQIVRRWPDVVFLSSAELGALIEAGEEGSAKGLDRIDVTGSLADTDGRGE